MDVFPIQSLGALPSTGMDRKGISGNIDGFSAWGFEHSLMALLGMPSAAPVESDPDSLLSIASGNLQAQAKAPSPLFQALNSEMNLEPAEENLLPHLKTSEANLFEKSQVELPAQFESKNQDLNQSAFKQSAIDIQSLAKEAHSAEVKNLQSSGKNVPETKINSEPAALAQVAVGKSEVVKQATLVQGMAQVKLDPQQPKAAHSELPSLDTDVEVVSKEISSWKLHKDNVHEESLPQGLKSVRKTEEKLDRSFGLKDLAGSLFVQKQLGNEFQVAASRSADFHSEIASAQDVRANLVEDMKAFVSQIVETNEGGSVNLRLRPGQLGEVEVRIELQSDSVRVHMEADNPAAEGLLKSQAGELKQQLQGLGLKLDELQISGARNSENLGDHKEGKNPQQFQQHQSKDQNGSEKEFVMDDQYYVEHEEAHS